MKPRLIGLVGYAGSGKSLTGKMLECHGYTRTRYAQILKEMLGCLGLTPEEYDGALKEQPCALLGGKTPRHAMLTLGTEWGRQQIDWDLWVRATMKRVDECLHRFPEFGVVIDDVRFLNEAAAIKELGGVIWRIERAGVGPGSGHVSETGQGDIPVDLVIENNSTEQVLASSIETALREYQRGGGATSPVE